MAAVVDSGPVSINVPATTAGIYLNLVTGLSGTATLTPGWDFNPYRASASGFNFFWPGVPAGTQGCVVSPAPAACVALTEGTTIGPASTFSASGVVAGTNFRTTGDRYVGFRFQNEATAAVNYGYAVMRNSTNADATMAGFPATIIRYVYDNAGVPIVVTPAGGLPGADLALTQSNNAPGAPAIGNTFQKTLTVTNNGPAAATGITVSDTLPSQLTFVSSNCGATATGQTVTYTIANLALAGVNNCALTVTINSSGTIVNTAAITASSPADPTPGNNTTTQQIGPTGGAPPPTNADLALTQSNNAAGSALLIGNTFQKTLTVTNNGPSAATAITVTDTLPAQLAFVSSNCGATATGQVVTYTIATLANAASSSCVLTVRVQATGTIVNTAAITASTPADPTPANNTTTAQIGPTGGGIAQTAVPALDLKSVLVLLGLVSAFGMLALRKREG